MTVDERMSGGGLSASGSEAGRTPSVLSGGAAEAFVHLLDLHDGHTARHSERVAELAVAIGRRMGLDHRRLEMLEQAARLHDLGKVGVPDRILTKNGPLDADEWAVMRCHPVWGAESLAGVAGLEEIATIVRFHHERWDGRGYPDGLAGDDIPLESRIVGACDAFCSITADRPYRAALSGDRALDLIGAAAGSPKKGRRKVGQQFDPAVVAALGATVAERPAFAAARGADGRSGRFVRTEGGAESRPRRPGGAGSTRGQGSPGLTDALSAVGDLPALAESRHRLLRLLDETHPRSGRIADVIEADPGLTAMVMRCSAPKNGARLGAADVPEAVRALGPDALRTIAGDVRVFDFFEQVAAWRIPPERFRLHAVATQRAARRIARALEHDAPDALAVAGLLHDVGKLVLAEAYDGYPGRTHADAETPRERLQSERRALGMDHAVVGALVLRRWRLPERVVAAVAAHHDPDGDADAQVVGLADMLAHYAAGTPVDPTQMLGAARGLGITSEDLRSLMFDLQVAPASRPDHAEPCPLSEAELASLRGVAAGKSNQEVADERGVAASTVRSHLHSGFRKLDVHDRARAVLVATEHGWL
jgi:putative nucleotidyltransferase with HDIG domain